MELSLDTAENLLLEGQIKEVQNDALVLAKELTTENETKTVSKAIRASFMITYEAILKTIE